MEIFYLRYISYVFLLTAAIMAAIHLKKYRNSKEYYFIYFLWFVILVEIIGAIIRYVFDAQNFWFYNLYMVISFMFYLFWYRQILHQQGFKLTITLFMVIFLGVALWSHIYQSWNEYHEYTFVAGTLLVLLCALFHFWELLNNNQVLNVKYKLAFWISTGLLLFNLGMIPLMLLSKYLDISDTSSTILLVSMNFILYGCYIIGFQWTKEKYNRF